MYLYCVSLPFVLLFGLSAKVDLLILMSCLIANEDNVVVRQCSWRWQIPK